MSVGSERVAGSRSSNCSTAVNACTQYSPPPPACPRLPYRPPHTQRLPASPPPHLLPTSPPPHLPTCSPPPHLPTSSPPHLLTSPPRSPQANAGYPDGMKSIRTFNRTCTDLQLRKVVEMAWKRW